ncbi:MAG: hypothetical protein A3D24_03225 [Candidatus Blackburnbacteria bacterium RIFCSPHIGHO2_02_FULL_39_13]|uniref:Uncharacterized protein n=1 Tax=Candidatus Blackburnbacteria bacterium RIFCSPLOWO2_01_FULL_40_20 TaxID=1797519 RepID=A0A1G1VFM1_9BACT|nr:MAG: hypothetical protein A2694_04525 [Candidatus Blackburnbacteria bacterium RIFCSPHIGHO2_01_FULL_40_17]OGY08840.1 MAG: hypothetical protein A3D24_03225 [Candidatus Blackburnbacteria bacterium RIFCSPHIGHO2_02_FULL_39_13]OGY14214.1 MAG: hypothetical protein A3A77_01910 [Candidatus Blackburnbacteria bacterium RIFCSPLOWO2_01_FULL_40_20]HBL52424.1 hypothetical protein [Candidatus Blackburnbacteria bacterium]
MTEKSRKGGYAKRPLWQYILMYLVIGGIIYVLIYYFLIRGNYSPSLLSAPAPVQNAPGPRY